MKSREQAARAAYSDLPTADKLRVMSWVELGNTWEDAMLSSGVCSGPRPSTSYRMTPREAERQRQIDHFDEESLARRERNLLPNECSRRYETSHHEAAHAIVVMAFGKALRSISINSEDARSGLCTFEKGTTPLQTATICVAPIVWIEQVYYREFRYHMPWGSSGCESDLRKARDVVGDSGLDKAFKLCREILKENYDSVIAVANRLDSEGYYRP
ncbi:MAG TPA: hypothetical protein VFW64_15685 [Pseudonocardiaceae bacterium]|nr:hypothetical protein [Pseudonocardiaceae bacterium]